MTDVDFGVTDVVSSNFLTTEVDMGANQFTESSVSHLDLPHSSGVYMITDKASGARYIGSSVDIRRRTMQHFSALKTGKDENQPVYTVFKDTYNRAGSAGFDVTVLLLCDPDNLLMYEAQCISVDRKSTRLNSSHIPLSRMPSSA